MTDSEYIPGRGTLVEAFDRLRLVVHRTPVLTSEGLNRLAGCRLFFKCENFQKAGAFKFRGASNAVLQLTGEDLKRGVVTHSSGNHAQALALAARMHGATCHIVMPENAPEVKKDAVKNYGAQITFCPPTLADRERYTGEIIAQTGAVFIHPYNNYRIIAGQATAAMELIEDFPGLDHIVTPVGGGGLLSGTLLAVKHFSPGTKVLAAEPEGADDAFRSLRAGRLIPQTSPHTIADGLLTSLGDRTWPVIREHVHDILTVSDDEIIESLSLLFQRLKIVVEPSSATVLAAVLKNRNIFSGKRIGLILSGGNYLPGFDHLRKQ